MIALVAGFQGYEIGGPAIKYFDVFCLHGAMSFFIKGEILLAQPCTRSDEQHSHWTPSSFHC